MSMWEPFSERARRAIVLAQEAAQRLGNNYIAPEHIVLGVVEIGNNVVIEVLSSFGVTPQNIRDVTERTLREGKPVSQEMVFTPSAEICWAICSSGSLR
jgi:ATP-dependent Clp protease ATP-binding subunit ClpC